MKQKGEKKRTAQTDPDSSLRRHLIDLLNGGNAHVRVFDALERFPSEKRGVFAKGLPHTAWQLLEHLRIAQWDILEFSRDPKNVSPDFQAGYWPKSPAPENDAAWKKSLQKLRGDLQAIGKLLSNKKQDLHAPFAWGDGQTLLREALLLADHNAYHLGQLVDLKRALGIWHES
jgi:hypothetical protein